MVYSFLVQASPMLFRVSVSAISKAAHSNNTDQAGAAAPEAPEKSVITSSPVLSHNEQTLSCSKRTENREKEINRSRKTACSLTRCSFAPLEPEATAKHVMSV